MSLLWIPINVVQALFVLFWTFWCAIAAIGLSRLARSPRPGLWIAKYVWSPMLLAIWWVRIEVEGLERMDPSRPCFVVANHQSWLDIPLLFVALPNPVLFVAKQELASVPMVRACLDTLGMVFINRNDRRDSMRSVSLLTDRLRDGWSVLSFPEGTRSIDGRLKRFRIATFNAALESGVPVLPVALEGPARVVPRQGFRFRPGRVRVVITAPIATGGMSPDDRFLLAGQAQRAVAAELARLRGLSSPDEAIAEVERSGGTGSTGQDARSGVQIPDGGLSAGEP